MARRLLKSTRRLLIITKRIALYTRRIIIIKRGLLITTKKLTDLNASDYAELLKMIKQITNKGKLVFKGTVDQDEYTVSKVVQRMRAAKRKKDEGGK